MIFPRSQSVLRLWLAIVLCVLPLVVLAQSEIDAIPWSNDFILRTWNVEDGLPTNSILSLAQTRDGYLWIGTWSGLVRFDGLRFVTFSKNTLPSLPSDEINTVLATREGTLWAAFQDGSLGYLRNGALETILPSSNPPSNVHSLAEDSSGAIWASFTPNPKIAYWRQGIFTELSPKTDFEPAPLPQLHASTDGTIWLATTKSCEFFDGHRFQKIATTDDTDVRICAAHDGGMWVARGHHLFRYWKNGASEIVTDLPWLGGPEPITVLLEDRKGALWLGTRDSGLFRYQGGNFERVPTSLPTIMDLCEDREGSLWIATRGGGLNRLRPRAFFLHQAIPNPRYFRDQIVSSVIVDSEGRVSFAQGLSLARSVDARNRIFTLPPSVEPYTLKPITTLCADPAGGIWMGGWSKDIQYWRNNVGTVFEPFPGAITSFLMDRHHNLWISSEDKGLFRRTPEGSLTQITVNGLSRPRALTEDSVGRIWVGTVSGTVFRQEGDTFQVVPLSSVKLDEFLQFIVSDGKETVWIGFSESGLYRWKSGRIDHFPEGTGLPTDNLSLLEISPNGDFWFGTGKGLFRVHRREIEAVLEGHQTSLHAASFGRNEGLPTLSFNQGFLHASTCTPDGHIWLASTGGALEIVPQNIPQTDTSAPVLIEEVLVNDKPVSMTGGQLTFPPHPDSIQIRYTLPQLNAPDQLRFRYQLQGSGNGEWRQVGNQRVAVFTNPAPGDYVFRVSTITSPTHTASLSFTVRAAWWETLWFRIGCILAGALALATSVRTIVKRRMQARMRRLEQDHTLERERARIARDMHDELGAKLTHIMLMSDLAAKKTPSPDLHRITKTARDVSSTLDQIVWMTNPRNDNLKQLIGYIAEFAEEYFMDAPICLCLELPVEIPVREVSSDKRHHVLLVVREALANVAKHSGARNAYLRINLQPTYELRIVIQDDGRGFDLSTVSPTSNGLLNMRQRLDEIAGTLKIESKPGQGTTITLSVKV